MGNPFVHVELNTSDLPKAKESTASFSIGNSRTIRWVTKHIPFSESGTVRGAGMMKHPMAGAPSTWITYVSVDDVAESTKKAKSLGATIIKDVTDVPSFGALSIIEDPTGAVLALWTSKHA